MAAMTAWLGLPIDVPLLLAPMAGFGTVELAIGVARAGGLGALACASLTPAQADEALDAFRAACPGQPLNANFFCHAPPASSDDSAWRAQLAPYFAEFGVDPSSIAPAAGRRPFDDEACAWVVRARPEVVSFHFGLPAAPLLARVRATGARILSSATTVREAVWLAERGCDAVIAQGAEAGGHRGMFLATDASQQIGTFALVPQIADAVRVPVVATGGIADGRGIAAAFALGASAVQLGTVYLTCPEARTSALHRRALADARDDATALTNVFTGRPARGIANRLMREQGPLSAVAPAFPLAAAALAPLRARAEAAGSADFTNLWSGQAAKLAPATPEPAEALTARLVRDARAVAGKLRVL